MYFKVRSLFYCCYNYNTQKKRYSKWQRFFSYIVIDNNYFILALFLIEAGTASL